MKKVYFVFIAFLSFYAVQAQGLIINPNIVLKPGIYKDFQEFKNNNPSIPLPEGYTIDDLNRAYGTAFSTDSHTEYRIVINKKPVKVKTPAYGFCDGKNVYIDPSVPDMSSWGATYDKVKFFGRYCLYNSLKSEKGKREISRGGVAKSNSSSINIHSVDMSTGKVMELTKKNIRELIASDPELSAAFKAEKDPEDKLEEYLKQYALKHPLEDKKNL